MYQGRQERRQLDPVVLSRLCRQPSALAAICVGVQSGQLSATGRTAKSSAALDADDVEGETDGDVEGDIDGLIEAEGETLGLTLGLIEGEIDGGLLGNSDGSCEGVVVGV